MARMKLMSNALIDQVFLTRSENPEEALSRDEGIPEEKRAEVRDQHTAHEDSISQTRIERLRARLRELQRPFSEEVKLLDFLQKGYLAAFLTDVGRLPRTVVAAMLGLSPTAVGVAKWKVLADHPCGIEKGRCEGVTDCAHQHGANLCTEIVRRIASDTPNG
jgi:hypothetical protein